MNMQFITPGKERKRLALTIGKWLDREVEYLGAPTFAYRIGFCTIDRNALVSFEKEASDETVERLLEHLYEEGFQTDMDEIEEVQGIAIQIPANELSETALQNLHALVNSKKNLIMKALGVADLPIAHIEDRLDFAWFPGNPSPEEIKAYLHFVTALCDLAQNQRRVSAKEKPIENEKYAFRCFLLRLGFIGAEFKDERKILLRNLEGSSAFKSGQSKEATE